MSYKTIINGKMADGVVVCITAFDDGEVLAFGSSGSPYTAYGSRFVFVDGKELVSFVDKALVEECGIRFRYSEDMACLSDAGIDVSTIEIKEAE